MTQVFAISRMLALTSALLLAACSRPAMSVPPPVDASLEDPPSRVARLSLIEGTVSFKAAGTDEWVVATLNRPLTSGDQIWTAENSRAELDLGHAFVRMDGRTGIGVLTLDDRLVQLKLTGGTAQVRLQRLDEDDEFEVDTPQAAFTVLRTGDYRFNAAANGGVTLATARTGQLEAAFGTQAFSIRANQQGRLTSPVNEGESVTYTVTGAPPLDAFDTFCQTRDQRMEQDASSPYVSPYVIGREELSIYGTWRTYPAYGPVWIPRGVPPGWAPYRFGHWVWISPWGWTWIDDAPWGFAPFHYGRWIIIDGVWVWIPGPIGVRAVYAPALVVFVGGGPGLRYHVRIGVGLGVAWFPLGPREIYVPPYRTTRRYVTNVNISHTTIINTTNIWRTDASRQRYVNRTVTGAVTAVPEDVFVGARPVGPARANLSDREVRDLGIAGTAAPVAPSRASLSRGDPAGPNARPTPALEQRRVTVRQTPAPPAVPLERQRPSLDRDPGRPAPPSEIEPMRREQAPPDYRRAQPPASTERQRPSAQPTPPVQQPQRRPPAEVAPAPQRPGASAGRERTQQEPARQPSQRQTDNRRKEIDREHQRDEPRRESGGGRR